MHGKPRTKAQKYRITLITQELGCLACHIEGFGYEPCDYHHCDDQKQDHDRGYGLCPWHHRGIVPVGYSMRMMYEKRGDSKGLDARQFRLNYGTEQQLLDLQNQRIAEWEKSNVNSVKYITD